MELKKLNIITHRENLGGDLPDVILGKTEPDETKKTVLIYGHYDVQPVCGSPFTPHTVY